MCGSPAARGCFHSHGQARIRSVRPKPTKVYVVFAGPLFEPILESQPRHFLEVSSIRREKKCIIGHRDAGHLQIHRTDFDARFAEAGE